MLERGYALSRHCDTQIHRQFDGITHYSRATRILEQVLNKDPVKLDLGKGKQSQVAQNRKTRSEIIQHQTDSILIQCLEGLIDIGVRLQIKRLRYLDLQPGRVQSGMSQCGQNALRRLWLRKLRCHHIDGDPEMGRPLCRRSAGRFQNPEVKLPSAP